MTVDSSRVVELSSLPAKLSDARLIAQIIVRYPGTSALRSSNHSHFIDCRSVVGLRSSLGRAVGGAQQTSQNGAAPGENARRIAKVRGEGNGTAANCRTARRDKGSCCDEFCNGQRFVISQTSSSVIRRGVDRLVSPSASARSPGLTSAGLSLQPHTHTETISSINTPDQPRMYPQSVNTLLEQANTTLANIKNTLKQEPSMSKPGDYEAVAKSIRAILDQPDYDDGSIGPVLVRLAWHASGTFDLKSGSGGSNGATMRYKLEASDEANNGLENARRFLEPVKQKHPWITYADLWTFAGCVAIEAMGGPHINWKPGRVDYTSEDNVPPNGRLPDAAQGQSHVRDVFYRMGFNDQEIVALLGAHNLGRTHLNRSGFEGPWVPSPTRFSNTYFKLLVNEEWTKKKNAAGNWQYYSEDDELMMLPADMAVIFDPEFKKWAEKYAADKDLFYRDFAAAFSKLLELGVRRGNDGLAKINLVSGPNPVADGKL